MSVTSNNPKAAVPPPPPNNPARPRLAARPPGGAAVGIESVKASTLQLANVVNPNRQKNGQDAMQVIRGGTPFDKITGESILSGDEIICELDASGKVTGEDSGSVARMDVVSFAGDDPADVEVDWSNVTAVDDYYNGEGYTHEITVDSPNSEIILIVG